MNEQHAIQLPPEWVFPTPEQTEYLLRELGTEAPVEHVLYQQPVEVFAVRTTCDDVAYRLIESPERIVVVHLTWVGHTECEGHPTVEFDGSIPEFCGFCERQYAEFVEHQKLVAEIMERRREGQQRL